MLGVRGLIPGLIFQIFSSIILSIVDTQSLLLQSLLNLFRFSQAIGGLLMLPVVGIGVAQVLESIMLDIHLRDLLTNRKGLLMILNGFGVMLKFVVSDS